jgi:hypothetical protein
MLLKVTVAGLAVLPALSTQEPLLVTEPDAVSVDTVPPVSALLVPDRASVHVNVTVTSRLVQAPAVYGPALVLALAVIAGGVLSTLMLLNVAGLAVLPALSTQEPLLVTEPDAVSVDTVPPVSTLLVPDRASVHVNVTVTSRLVQVPAV